VVPLQAGFTVYVCWSKKFSSSNQNVPGHSGIRGKEIAHELAREGSAHHCVGPEPAVGVSRQCIRRKIQCWMNKQHLVRGRGLVGTMRQTQELILGPNTAARTALISFNPLKTKRNLLYIETQCVPRSKHFQPRL
jgi:hypothetical protein